MCAKFIFYHQLFSDFLRIQTQIWWILMTLHMQWMRKRTKQTTHKRKKWAAQTEILIEWRKVITHFAISSAWMSRTTNFLLFRCEMSVSFADLFPTHIAYYYQHWILQCNGNDFLIKNIYLSETTRCVGQKKWK